MKYDKGRCISNDMDGANTNGRTSAANAPIGVFDSGAGGLTVVRQIRKILPNESVLYFGDTGHVPYGPRPQSQVCGFSVEISEFLQARGAKAIIIACNTATAAALEALEASFSGPVIGVIRPGAKAAFDVAGSDGKAGLIATQGTVASGVYDRELANLGLKAALVKQACPDFVTLVEGGMTDEVAIEDAVKRYAKPFYDSRVDVLILGCTHFPLLADYIQKEMPGVALVDPAIETVMAIKAKLEKKALLAQQGFQPEYKFFCSGDPASFKRSVNMILGPNDYPVEQAIL